MKRYILLILLFIAFTAHAQEIDHTVRLANFRVETRYMNEDISTRVLDFGDAFLDDNYGLLPVYIYRFRLPSSDYVFSAEIKEEHTAFFEHPGLDLIADAEKINAEFGIQSSIIYQEGIAYGELLLLPFKDISNKGVTVMDSCLVHITMTETAGSQRATSFFVENSVLAEGKWLRLATDKTGVYRITYDELTGMGIDPSGIDPTMIRIFGNGNGIIPEKNSDERFDDLMENAIYVHGEADGVFNEEDYILFYGQSAVNWKFVPFQGFALFAHEINFYTDQTFYFLNIEMMQGKRIATASYPALPPTVLIEEFTDYAAHENDTVNILKTGREWYGENYSEQTSYEYTFDFPNIVTDYKVSLMTSVAAHSVEESKFDFYYSDQHLLEAPVSKIIVGTTVYAWTSTPDTIGFYPVQGDQVSIRVDYDKPTSTSVGWMNFVSVNARRQLIFTGPYMSFRDHLSFGPEQIAEYKVSGADDQLIVWDVTDPLNITRTDGSLQGDKYSFVAPAEEIREFIAFDGSDFESAEFVEEVKNQNLHSYDPVDYIILTHPDYMDQAQRMLTLHQHLDQMSGFIITPQEIYNEFASGKQDPSAIRDFVRMLYDRADTNDRRMYLLMLGDASYDYKDRVPDNTNLVPTYQSLEALKLGYSFVTDDFFGLMDPGEGANAWGKSVDIGIGRFPVHSVEQADAMVDKVETYMTLKPNVLGPWQNDMYFIAHDGDQNLHFNQAEKLQTMIDTGYQVYNRLKIYCDAFPMVSTSSGDRYPGVNDAIDRMMGKGSLVVNYTGHGGESGWAYQSILDIPMINAWTNWDRLPLFITATCEFSRYDDPGMISAGEWVFLNPYGGSIGLLTTSRLAWADPNFRLNKAVYRYMFQRPGGEYYKIGDIVRLAKTDQNNGTNIKNFVLLGDPAMKLAYPDNSIITTSVNGSASFFQPDTLTSMSKPNIQGMIMDHEGDTLNDFNGVIYIDVYDQDVVMSTLGNRYGSIPANFNAQGQKLYSGRASVVDGAFNCDFFMPQNMTAAVGYGKISYYAYDTINMRDAQGYYKARVGGVNLNAAPDAQGPDMSLYLNNTDFVSGQLTDSEPVFLAYLYDEHGINFTSNGIGRDITLTLDGDPQSTIVLNDLFDPDMDSYQSGWLSYPLSDLEDGKHTLTLKAWDNMNNVSEKSIEFEVSVDGPLALTSVMNYPNPFSDRTYFVFDHNKPGNSFDVEIRIFNINGQFVDSLRAHSSAEGLSISPLMWDGTDSGGNKLGTGIYIYRLYVTDAEGAQFVQTSKLIFTGKQ